MGIDPFTLIIGTIISIGLSIAASALLKPKNKGVVIDDKPTTLAERGAYLPWMLGRRRLGAVFCWAGDRRSAQESATGGKGAVFGGAPKETVYYESAWHVLCCGPAYRLHRIWQDGKIIFEGPIDAVSHPSGSSIPTQDGSFDIYWGQPTQPVNTFLGTAGRVVDEGGTPVQSRWPFLTYVVWRDKRLGGTARWPLIDYDLEVRIVDTSYCSGAPWIESIKTLTGSPVTITGITNGAPGTNKIRVDGNHLQEFKPGDYLRLAGNATTLANGDYRIRKVDYVPGIFSIPIWGMTSDHTDIYLDFTLTGATVSGTVQPVTISDTDGVNPAHAVATILFGKHPTGLGLDTSDFDLTTLDDLSQKCIDEGLACSLVAQQGDTAEAMLGVLMQDVGFLIPWDVTRGKYVFRMIRQEAPGAVTAIDKDIVLPPGPEVTIIHGEKPTDKLVYVFQDRSRNFRDMTIQVEDDSQETLLAQQRIQKVQLPSVISYEIANKVAERRAQEELTGGAGITFKFNRGARFFVPGHVFTVPDYPGTYRVERTVIDDSLSGEVEVAAIIDIFGSKPSTFVPPNGGGSQPVILLPQVDLAYAFLEVPSHVSPGKEKIVVPRIRAHNQIVGADIFLSRDGSTYSRAADDKSQFTGGTLTANFDQDTYQYLAQGPTISAIGPDIASVLDLSGDPASWGAGRQLALIDDELFYLQKVTALGGGLYRLDGLLRARFDTQRAAHLSGTPVFIFQNDVLQIEDALLSPSQALFMKPLPKTSVSMALSLVPPVNRTLVGKGVTPMAIELLCAADAATPIFLPNNAWVAGGNALLKWAYRSTELSRSGAGFQGYGMPAGTSAVQGIFTIRIKTTGDVLKNTYSSATPDFTYTQAQMVADFGAEPAAFKAEVFNSNGGLNGPSKVITASRI